MSEEIPQEPTEVEASLAASESALAEAPAPKPDRIGESVALLVVAAIAGATALVWLDFIPLVSAIRWGLLGTVLLIVFEIVYRRKAPPAEAGEHKVDWLRELRGLALMLLAVLGFHTFLAKPFYIPSESMMPNLLVGDRLVVSKYPYGWSWVSASFHILPRNGGKLASRVPEYGDIVIAVPPNKDEDYIKRVIGLPGDRIALNRGQVWLNGKPVPRRMVPPVRIPVDANAPCDASDYGLRAKIKLPSGALVCQLPAWQETLPNGATYTVIDEPGRGPFDDTEVVVVPSGHVFLMGDNRDHSADSRAPIWESGLGGPVPLSSVGGRAEFLTFSLDGSMTWNPATWFGAFRSGRAGTSLRPAIVAEGKADGGK